jgi:hypothetical protein
MAGARRPVSWSEIMARSWTHRRCSSHVAVEGAGRVCVLAGQDPEAVVGFARWAADLAVAAGRRMMRPGPARVAPSAERLRHVACSAHIAGGDWGLGRLCVPRGSSVGDVAVFAAEIARAREAQAAALLDRVATARELAAAGAWPAYEPAGLAAPLAEWAAA